MQATSDHSANRPEEAKARLEEAKLRPGSSQDHREEEISGARGLTTERGAFSARGAESSGGAAA